MIYDYSIFVWLTANKILVVAGYVSSVNVGDW